MKALQYLGVGCACMVGLAVLLLIILGINAPETSIYVGNQTPKSYVKKVRELNLIEPDEEIRFFYSDGIMGITEGMYLTTDKTLVLYDDEWEKPAIKIPLESITSVEPSYNDSFLEDSMIFVTDESGESYTFPLSSEYERDRKFVEHMQRHIKQEGAAGSNDAE